MFKCDPANPTVCSPIQPSQSANEQKKFPLGPNFKLHSSLQVDFAKSFSELSNFLVNHFAWKLDRNWMICKCLPLQFTHCFRCIFPREKINETESFFTADVDTFDCRNTLLKKFQKLGFIDFWSN